MIIARTVFCLSMAATLFWISGFAAERVAGTEPPPWSYALPAIGMAAVAGFAVFRAWPRFLTVSPGTTGRFLRAFAVWTLLAYVVGVVAVGGVAHLLLNPSAQPSEALRSEASLARVVLALWFPIWFAPAVGLSLGWWRAAGAVRSNSAIEKDVRESGARPHCDQGDARGRR